jgi:anti-anti-sigma factor
MGPVFTTCMSMARPGDDTVRVHLPAVVDERAVNELRPLLRELAADGSVAGLVLDAEELRFIGGRGLGLLAAVGLIARGRGARAYVVNCQPRLLPLMRMSRLPAVAGETPDESKDSVADWTPWWTSAAANA